MKSQFKIALSKNENLMKTNIDNDKNTTMIIALSPNTSLVQN